MIQVKFSQQWRGHEVGVVVDLTDVRGAELIAAGYCKSTAAAEPVVDNPKPRGRPKKIVDAVVEKPSSVLGKPANVDHDN